jgi:hypothetical protein
MTRPSRRQDSGQVPLFQEDERPVKTQRIADWGTSEEHARARVLMRNLGERWGDQYAGQETMTEAEWRQRRSAFCWRIFDGDDEKLRRPRITAHEERAFRGV